MQNSSTNTFIIRSRAGWGRNRQPITTKSFKQRTLGSPIVIAHTEWLEIKLQESDDYFVTVDQLDIYQENIASVCYRIADERIHFASYRHNLQPLRMCDYNR
jgi:hypothetical protein